MEENEDIIKILDNELSESDWLDYKYKYYQKGKYRDLIADILSFLNVPINKDKYLLFGIKDNKNGKEIVGVKSFHDPAELEQLVKKYITSEPSIKYGTLKYENKTLSYIKILKENYKTPYFVKEDYLDEKKIILSKNTIYSRFSTSNKKIKPVGPRFKELMDYQIKKDPESISFYEEKQRKLHNEKFQIKLKCNKGNFDFFGDYNDGIVEIYFERKVWIIKFEVASNNCLRIYNDEYGSKNIKYVGTNIVDKIDLYNFDIDTDFNLTSKKAESNFFNNKFNFLIAINKQNEFIIFKPVKLQSSSHGFEENKAIINFWIV